MGTKKSSLYQKFIDLAGAWEGSLAIDISTRDIQARDNLISILMLMFTDWRFESLRKAGVLIKSGQPSLGGISETEDRQQEKLYKATITIDIRSEWRRLIPVSGIVEQINFCVDFKTIDGSSNSPNLRISDNVSILDQIENL